MHGASAFAVKLVPQIEPTPWAVEGSIEFDAPAQGAVRLLRVGDLVICRSNAPLVSLSFRLIQDGIPVLVRGRDVGEKLISIIRDSRATATRDLIISVETWRDRQVDSLEAAGAGESEISSVVDAARCVVFLAQQIGTVDGVVKLIQSLFEDSADKRKVVLSSIHRAKGLEADRVILYEPGIIPIGHGLQELNLLYVALTRSKNELLLVDHEKRRRDPQGWVDGVAGLEASRDLTIGEDDDEYEL